MMLSLLLVRATCGTLTYTILLAGLTGSIPTIMRTLLLPYYETNIRTVQFTILACDGV